MRPTEQASVLTVAAIRERDDRTEVLFNERQQVFSLSGSRAAARHEARLREA